MSEFNQAEQLFLLLKGNLSIGDASSYLNVYIENKVKIKLNIN